MIDARRWILVEAWLALGLRVEWMPSWEASSMPLDEWQDDGEGHRFVYAGNRTWLVEDRGRSPLSRGAYTAPQLGTDSLAHELAHYLAATAEQRGKRNFGIAPGAAGSDDEEAAVAVEQVIDAMVAASSRIAELALRGRP